MKSFKLYLEEQEYSQRTQENYINYIKEYLDWVKRTKKRLKQVKHKDIIEFITYLQRKGKPNYEVNRFLNTVKHYYTHLDVKVNPVQGVKLILSRNQKIAVVLDKEAINDIYNTYPNQSLTQYRNKVILGLICFQAVKTGELEILETSHIDFEKGVLNIPNNRKTNGRALKLETTQVLELYKYITEVRKELLKIRGDKSDLLFFSTGKMKGLLNVKASITNQLKGNYRNFQTLSQIRNSVIVQWVRTENLRIVQYKAGHRYVSSTEKFKIEDIEDLKEKVELFHPI